MENVREIHTVLLEMMKAVRDICDRHEIRYFLYCGTLLGAVRHGGFIPWDDDADIAMPLNDYLRFMEIAEKELPKRFTLLHPGNTKEYPYIWAQLMCNGTTFMDSGFVRSGMHLGLSLDIYPFLGIPKNRFLAKLQVFAVEAARQLSRLYLLRRVPVLSINRLRKAVKYIPIPFLPLCWVGKALYKIAMVDPEKTKYACTIDAAPYTAKYLWKDWQEDTVLSFEDELFNAPAEYDRLLRIMYGDYMKLPPKEQQKGHLDIPGRVIIDMHKDYHEYIRNQTIPNGN